MSTETLAKEKIDLKEQLKNKHQIVLFDDNVNTFDFVIEQLVKVCKHDPLQAEQCAFITHYKGKCSIKKGEYNFLQTLAETLADNGLTVEIQ